MKTFILVSESLRRLAFSEGAVPAGFPSPAEDYMQSKIDLNEQLVRWPAHKDGKEGMKHDWKMKSEMRSHRYATSWDELLSINI